MLDIPITVFTGFLGAGKTSIILSLLPQLPKEYKVVLLKNEFGNVEGKLVYSLLCSSPLT
jgi:G3E family GTPase